MKEGIVMEVEVRLFATFRKGRFKKQNMELSEGARLREVLRQRDISEEEVSLPLVNGKYSDLDRELADRDVFSVFPAVGGG